VIAEIHQEVHGELEPENPMLSSKTRRSAERLAVARLGANGWRDQTDAQTPQHPDAGGAASVDRPLQQGTKMSWGTKSKSAVAAIHGSRWII